MSIYQENPMNPTPGFIAKTSGAAALLGLLPPAADPFFFSTGNPDGKIATTARPDSPFGFEIETGDDFVLTGSTSITNSTFTGLITANAVVSRRRPPEVDAGGALWI